MGCKRRRAEEHAQGWKKDKEKGGGELPSPPHPGPKQQAATQRLSDRTCHSLPGEGAGPRRPVETRVGSRVGTERAC